MIHLPVGIYLDILKNDKPLPENSLETLIEFVNKLLVDPARSYFEARGRKHLMPRPFPV